MIKQGDIVFFKSDGSWWDFFIRLVSPNYTHVGMALDEHRVLDASVRGVGISPIKKCHQIKVMRIKGAEPEKIKDALIGLLELSRKKNRYGYAKAVLAGALRLLGLRFVGEKISNEWFCSEIMVYAIRKWVGKDVMSGRSLNSIMPDEFQNDEYLEEVKHG